MKSLSPVVGGLWALARTNSATMLAGNLAQAGIGVVTGVLIARALGPAGRGDLAVLCYWPILLAAAVDFSLLESTALRTATGPDRLASILLAAGLLAAAASAVGVALGWLLLPHLLRAGQQHLLHDADSYLLYIPASLFGSVALGALEGLQRFRAAAAVRFWTGVAYLAAVVALWLSGKGTIVGFAWAAFGARALPIFPALLLVVGGVRASKRALVDVQSHAVDGTKLQAARLVSLLVGSEDRAIATLTLTQAEIGLYQVPAALATVVPTCSQIIGKILFVRYAAATNEERPGLVVQAHVRALVLTAATALACVLLLPWAVPLAYGVRFEPSVVPALIVVAGSMVGSGSILLQSAARAAGRVSICILAELAAAFGMAVAAVPLTRWLGVSGLALAFSVGRLISFAWMVVAAPRQLPFERNALNPLSRLFREQALAELATVRRLLHRRG